MNLELKEKQYKKYEESYFSCQYIVVFSTKYKRKIITKEIEEDLKNIFKNISEKYKFEIISMEIYENQIMLYLDCNPNFGIKKTIIKLKNLSAKILKEKYPYLTKRVPSIWTREEFISTTGSVNIKDINDFLLMQTK